MAEKERNHVAIEMEAMLRKAPAFNREECCIYRVPPRLRRLTQDAYTPNIVSIGPLHHGHRQLLNMEPHKQMYCRKFIETRSEAHFDDLVSCVQDLEPKVRGCYSDNIKLDADKLVKVILVDCCFVLELLVTELEGNSEQSKPWLMKDIMWDLLLLENQLPFFVFEKLYNLSFASALRNHGLPSFFMFASCWFLSSAIQVEEEEASIVDIAHFLDLYRYSFLQPYGKQLRIDREKVLNRLYSATELNEAGVKFKVNESKSFLDIQFVGCCFLKIPQFRVSDST